STPGSTSRSAARSQTRASSRATEPGLEAGLADLLDPVHGPAERPPLVERHRRQDVVVADELGIPAHLSGPGGVVKEVVAVRGHDHVVAGRHVVELRATGRAWPRIGVDRVPVAVAGAGLL